MLDNTQYFEIQYWIYWTILSILIFDNGYTGQYSVFRDSILTILDNTQYAGGGCVFVCVPRVLIRLFSTPQAGLAAIVGAYNVLNVSK